MSAQPASPSSAQQSLTGALTGAAVRPVDFLCGARREPPLLNAAPPARPLLTQAASHSNLPIPENIPLCPSLIARHPLEPFIQIPGVLKLRDINSIVTTLSLTETLPENGILPASTSPFTDYSKHAWLRDQALTCYGLMHAGDKLHARNGLLSMIRFYTHEQQRGRLTTALFHPDPAGHFASDETGRHAPVRLQIVGDNHELTESPAAWAHFQTDALGMFPWVFFRLANEGHLDLREIAGVLKDTAHVRQHEECDSLLSVWLKSLVRMEFWNQRCSGPWEEDRQWRRAVSVGSCLGALIEAQQYFERHGWRVAENLGGNELRELIERGITEGTAALETRLPKDGSFAIDNDRFPADAALSILFWTYPDLNRAQGDAILRVLYAERMDEVGFTRHAADNYLGKDYAHRRGAEGTWSDLADPNHRMANWAIFDSLIGDYLFRRSIRDQSESDYRLADRHLRRALAQLTPEPASFSIVERGENVKLNELLVPEAYWWDSTRKNGAGDWVPNHNTPLLMGCGAFARMLASAKLAAALREGVEVQ